MDSLRITLIILGAVFIALIYTWEKIKQRKRDARYARWGGVSDDTTETRVIRGYRDDPERDSRLVSTAYDKEPAEDEAPVLDEYTPVHDDVPELDDVVSTAETGELVDDELPAEHSRFSPPAEHIEVDLDSDPELDKDPISDITTELEALEEMISSEADDNGQLELGDFDVPVESEQPIEPERIIAVHVLAREGSRFYGPDILNAFMHNDMQFGDMSIFHRQDANGKIVFSIANALEPGVFDMANMDDFSTKALLFILTLPNPVAGLEAFDTMLEAARGIADSLNGRLCDDKRSVLTRQAIDELRREVSTSF